MEAHMKIPKIISCNNREYIIVKEYPNFVLYRDWITGIRECFSFHELGLIEYKEKVRLANKGGIVKHQEVQMINKDLLEQISSLNEELKDLKKRCENAKKKETEVLADSVQASSKEYPYTQHTITIQGVDYKHKKHYSGVYKKQIKSKEYKIEKLIKQIEYELNYIEDSEIRRIIRYKYEDNLNWIQVMFKMNYNSESTAKVKLKRFLENL